MIVNTSHLGGEPTAAYLIWHEQFTLELHARLYDLDEVEPHEVEMAYSQGLDPATAAAEFTGEA